MRSSGAGPDPYPPVAGALAVVVHRLGGQVHVAHKQVADLRQPRPRGGVEADERLIPQLGEALALAELEQTGGLLLAQHGDQSRRGLGHPDPFHRRAGDGLLVVGEPAEELLQALVFVHRGRGGPGVDHPGLDTPPHAPESPRPDRRQRRRRPGPGSTRPGSGRAGRRRAGSCSGWSPGSCPPVATDSSRPAASPRRGRDRR
jgi:hypothetical protein